MAVIILIKNIQSKCQSFQHNYDIILPFFQKYRIIGVKSLDFIDWCKIAVILKNKAQLTEQDLNGIKEIKAGMNRTRKQLYLQ